MNDKEKKKARPKRTAAEQNIMNCASEIPVTRIIGMVEDVLLAMGAQEIQKRYSKGGNGVQICDMLIFKVWGGSSAVGDVSICLPVNIPAAYDKLVNISYYKKKKQDWLIGQAQRTSWKIILDYLKAQLARIQLGQAETIECFLAYVYSAKTGNTFYRSLKATENYKVLTS